VKTKTDKVDGQQGLNAEAEQNDKQQDQSEMLKMII